MILGLKAAIMTAFSGLAFNWASDNEFFVVFIAVPMTPTGTLYDQ